MEIQLELPGSPYKKVINLKKARFKRKIRPYIIGYLLGAVCCLFIYISFLQKEIETDKLIQAEHLKVIDICTKQLDLADKELTVVLKGQENMMDGKSYLSGR